MKREGPVAVAFLTGAVMLLAYFINNPGLKSFATQIQNWRVIIAAFALALGAVNMLMNHSRRIATRRPEWLYSVVFIGFYVVALAIGVSKGLASKTYQYIWQNLYQPASATMYSFTLFYMASAAWRAFRIKNWQAAVLMFTGFIVILGQVGLGQAISPLIPKAASWIISYPNSAGIRAITIGGSLGMVSVGIRVILGLERTYMSGGRED